MTLDGPAGKTKSTHPHGAPIVDVPSDPDRGKLASPGDWVAVYVKGTESRAVPAVLHTHRHHGTDKMMIDLDLALRTVLGMRTSPSEESLGDVAVSSISATNRGRWSKPPRRSTTWWLWIRKLFDRVMPTSAVLCQVHKMPTHLAEQNVALLDESAMQILGLSPGDEVVLSAVAPVDVASKPGEFHRFVKVVKAYEHSVARGLYEVPVVQLGEAMRNQLGLDSAYLNRKKSEKQPTDPVPSVLVTPSRGYALTDNLREVALVISLGSFGVAVSLSEAPSSLRWSLALVGGVLLPLALILWRVRTRLR